VKPPREGPIFVPYDVTDCDKSKGGDLVGILNRKTPTEETITFLRECGPTCSSRELAKALGGQPYYYNVQAKNGNLPFEYMWRGRALRIFTESVIKKLKGE